MYSIIYCALLLTWNGGNVLRYVPIESIDEGMVLGKTLYGEMGEVLLREGTTILSPYINKLKCLGYSGIYIHDKISEDIKVHDIISEDLKMKTIKRIKNFVFLEKENYEKIENSIEGLQDSVSEMIDQISSNKELIVNMIDLKVASNYTFYHSVNVCMLSIVLGIASNLSKEDLYLLGLSSLLHDIGKISIPKEILNKPGKLTKEEFDIIKKHSEIGYNYVKKSLNVHTKVYLGIYDHHERFDGKGYPRNLCGYEISTFGRIISIADVYDALTSDRPYRKGILPSDSMEYIMASSGSIFDFDIAKVFSSKIAPYPVGTCVNLSNGCVAIVAKNFSGYCLRPLIKVIKIGNKEVEPYYINLKDSNYNITITGFMDALCV